MNSAALQQINKRLIKVNDQFQKLFNNFTYKSPQLNRKQFSLLMQTVYSFIETGQASIKSKNKQIFLSLFKSYIKNFINSHILAPLQRSTHYQDFQDILSQRWRHFKVFTFYYFALLNSANAHYQTKYFIFQQKGIQLSIDSQQSVFPIPVIALNSLKKLILDKFQQKIQHIVLKGIKNLRNQKKQKLQNLKNFLQLIWACGLAQIARIRIVPGIGIDFYKQQRVQYIKNIKTSSQSQSFFRNKILDRIIAQTKQYYTSYYNTKLSSLYPIQQFKALKQIIDKQQQFCQQFLITKKQRHAYMDTIYQNVVLNNIQQRLRAPGSLKSLAQNYNYTLQQGFQDMRIIFTVLKNLIHLKQVIKPLQRIFSQIIQQKGKQINQKINKRRQYILEMITLKKSIDTIIYQLSNKNFKLYTAKQKSYKKILDSIESSRNLADFTDFTIKQCIRLKLDDQRCIEKFNDIFLILSSTSSTDSFLLYHQQLLARRIIDPLNQPKLQFQLLMLKKLSQRMGVLSVSSNMSMLKDIETSQQTTQRYNARLPFSSFKWNLKIINPSHWPDLINKQKLNFSFPNSLLNQANAIQTLYHTQNQYKYLNWKLQRGTSLFDGKFNNKKYRFQSQNSYMMTLFLIEQENGNKIMFGNLKNKIKTAKNQSQSKNDPLSMLLYVLIENKFILRNSVEDKLLPFSQSQQIMINRNYTPPQGFKPQQAIIIRPSPQMSKKLQLSSIQKNKIQKDRQKVIQAVLVKQLKHSHATGDNSVTFSQLFHAVQQHPMLGAFNYSQSTIKKILEQLIVRQYCQRDENDRKVYHYVA